VKREKISRFTFLLLGVYFTFEAGLALLEDGKAGQYAKFQASRLPTFQFSLGYSR
jgi:hypothetical protein